MTQAAHVFRKDVRRLRWSVTAWAGLVAARTFVKTAGADIALGGFGPQLGIAELWTLLSLIYVLFLAFLVSRLVHDEPLVGYDAFWITRPIAPSALAAAKLAFAALFLVVVPLAGSLVVAAVFGTPGGDIAKTIPVVLLNQLMLVTFLMAIAAVTPSLNGYVLALVGAVAAFVALMASLLLVALAVTGELEEGSGPTIPDPTPAVVSGMLLVLTALAVIVYQYVNRRRGRALAVAALGIVLAFVVPATWRWSPAAQAPVGIAAAPPGTPAVAVSLDGSRPRVNDGFAFRRRTPPRKEVAARATVAGVPHGFNVRTILARSRLEWPGGVVLQTGGGNVNAVLLGSTGGSTAGRAASIEAALGNVRLLTGGDDLDALSSGQWPVLLRVDEEDFVRHRAQPGRLTSNLDIVFEQPTELRVLPLADGASTETGATRVSIVHVIRRATGCTVLLRRSHVEPLFSRQRYREFVYVLRNGPRREAAGADVQLLSPEGFSAGAFFMAVPHVGGRGFVLEQYALQFPARMRPDGGSVDLDQAWLAGAELVILEVIPAGAISRTVTIEGFRMAPRD